MKTRQVKPEFWDHPDLCAMGDTARLLFISLWCQADRDGRVKYEPERIARRFNPYRHVKVEPVIEKLSARGLVIVYRVDDVAVLLIPAFRDHQHVHPGEAKSKLPELTPGSYRELPVNAGSFTCTSSSTDTDTCTSSDPGSSCHSVESEEVPGRGMSTVAYFEGGVGRLSTAGERRSIQSLVTDFGHDAVCSVLGQVKVQGEPTNFKLTRHILKVRAAEQ